MTQPRPMTWFQRWLDALPTTNWKTWWFVVLTAATFLNNAVITWYILVWAARHPGDTIKLPDLVEGMHDAWLLYLAGFGGITLGQFMYKRKTFGTPSPDSERADVPTTPAPKEMT